jgi:hypothetical protein
MARTAPEGIVSSVDRESLKQEIKAELQLETSRKALRKKLGCAAFLVLFFGVIACSVLAFVAKTGLVRIPFFTAAFYKPAVASRVVRPLVGSMPEQVAATIATRVRIDSITGIAKVTVTETELTTLVRAGLAQSGNGLALQNGQVSIDADAMELFGIMIKDGREIPARVRIAPVVRNENVELEIRSAVIGGASVSPAVAGALTSSFLRDAMNAFSRSIESFGVLEDIILESGKLTIVVRPKPRADTSLP